ncbi:unnamed protein product [Auanema sp. JU1783]|nr:unnamed protein product [Auanema sp. JU1783]
MDDLHFSDYEKPAVGEDVKPSMGDSKLIINQQSFNVENQQNVPAFLPANSFISGLLPDFTHIGMQDSFYSSASYPWYRCYPQFYDDPKLPSYQQQSFENAFQFQDCPPPDPPASTPSTSVASFQGQLLGPNYISMPYPANPMNQPNMFANWRPSTKSEKVAPVPFRTGPGTNNVRVRTAEKYRMVYNEYQRIELEKEYHTSAFVSADRKAELSTRLQLTERQIKIWFQNRRAKDRRKKNVR